MASLHDYLAQNHKIDTDWLCTGNSVLRVTEVRKHEEHHLIRWSSYSLDLGHGNLKLWLQGSYLNELDRTDHIQEIVLRIVWIVRHGQSRTLDVDVDTLNDIHCCLGYDVGQPTSSSILAGVRVIKIGAKGSPVYDLTLLPKISMIWSQNKDPQCTTIVCMAEHTKVQMLQNLLQQDFICRLATHVMLPCLLAAILFSTEIDTTQEALKQEIRRVEVRTGHHDWKSRAEAPALGNLVALTARMSGCSTRAASCLRKQHTLSAILEFVLQHLDNYTNSSEVVDIVHVLTLRHKAQQIDMDFIKHRSRTQLDALYHLVAQNDAYSAQEMAQDTRLIAAAAQRDSTSMKCIAILTMFFLPGTFVSSLLSVPLFDWDAETTERIYRSSRSVPILRTFSAITLPTMLAIFIIWGAWMLRQSTLERKKSVVAATQLQRQSSGSDEVRQLASRRALLAGKTT